MHTQMNQFNDLLKLCIHGQHRADRTGTGTRAHFGYTMEFDHRVGGFPLLSTKYTNFNALRNELLWFISGSTNIADLDSKIWDEWADDDGEVGPVYGHQWRSWNDEHNGQSIDQLAGVISSIKENPQSRRHIISAWNVADIPEMALPPCHMTMQFFVHSDEEHLSMHVYQRSADMMLGVPFNIASYSLLLRMVAQVTGLKAARHIHTFGDAHVYNDHMDAAKEILTRGHHDACEVFLNPEIDDIDDFTKDDIVLSNYNHHPKMDLNVSV